MFRFKLAFAIVCLLSFYISASGAFESIQTTDGVLPPLLEQTQPARHNKTSAEHPEILGIVSSAPLSSFNRGAKTSDTGDNSSNHTAITVWTAVTAGILTFHGIKFFASLPEIIFAIAVGGFFGRLNWKWLSMIIAVLLVMTIIPALITYIIETSAGQNRITDTLISAR